MSISGPVNTFVEQTGFHPTADQWAKLEDYVRILVLWNRTINLVRYKSMDELWIRHVLESFPLMVHMKGMTLVDVGAGAGCLSVPVAICRQEIRVIGIESRHKRTVFLREVRRLMRLPYEIIRDRLESWLITASLADSMIVMRALPGWERWVKTIHPYSTPTTHLALFLGDQGMQKLEIFANLWSVKDVIPIPQKRASSLVILASVSRET